MALKVELRPHERIIVGNCVITNTDQRARLLIDEPQSTLKGSLDEPVGGMFVTDQKAREKTEFWQRVDHQVVFDIAAGQKRLDSGLREHRLGE